MGLLLRSMSRNWHLASRGFPIDNEGMVDHANFKAFFKVFPKDKITDDSMVSTLKFFFHVILS